MTDLRKMLRQIRVREDMDQSELASKLGVSRSAVANWETGKANIAPEHRETIQKLFPYVKEDGGPQPLKPGQWHIRKWGAISAGTGNVVSPDLDETYIPNEFDRDDYGAMTADGDSMMELIFPSDILIFRDWKQAKIGHVMAAELPNGDWVCKLLTYEHGEFLLRSLNPKYADIPCRDVRLVGFLVGIIRDTGDERLIRLNPKGLKPVS